MIYRAKEREKKKIKLQKRKELGEDLGPSRKLLRKNCMKNSQCKLRVVFDCSFDEFMTERVKVNKGMCVCEQL